MYQIIRESRAGPEPALLERLEKELSGSAQKIQKRGLGSEEYCFEASLKFLIPDAGIANNNVHRLLLKSGSEKHLSTIPMAIFMEQIDE